MTLNDLKKHQQTIILAIGYVCVLIFGFALGKIYPDQNTEPIRIEEVFSPPNNSENLAEVQSNLNASGKPEPLLVQLSVDGECNGKIKGNLGSGNDRVYHIPTGSFYKRVAAEICFDNEKQAVAAGFRKSGR